MPTVTAEKELLELENQYWQTMRSHDVEAAVRLTSFPCLVAGASGVGLIDEPTYRKMMTGAKWKLHDFRITDGKVQFPNDDTALVAYKVHEDLTVEGEKVKLDAADTSVWVRRGGKWLCAMHTESVSGDSYGRDKKK